MPDGILTEGLRSNMKVFVFVWLYCIFWWFVQDAAKVLTYRLMYKTNYNNINNVVGIQEKK
jgi:H+-transporting ATPase